MNRTLEHYEKFIQYYLNVKFLFGFISHKMNLSPYHPIALSPYCYDILPKTTRFLAPVQLGKFDGIP